MRKPSILLCSILILVSNVLHGQVLPIGHDTLLYNHQLVFSGGYDYAANSVQNAISSKFLRGGEITEEMKDASLVKHRAVNRIGGIVIGELNYSAYDVKLFKDWGLNIKAGYDLFGGLIYSKDFFGLAFYGNQPYLGDTVSMSGMNATYTSFQKLGFGITSPKSKASVTLNFYNIDNHFDAHFRTFEFIQDESGDSFSIEMDGEIEMPKNSRMNQGFGVGVDVDFRLPIAWGSENTAFIQFQAKNIGIGFSSQPYTRYYTDTSITFDGFTLDELIGDNSFLGDTSITVNSVLDSIGIYSNNFRPTYLLPGFIQIAKIVDEHYTGKFQPFFGVRLYPTLIYSPMVFGGLDYKPIEKLRVGANLSFGGFTGLRGGLYANANFGIWKIGLSTETIRGWISQKAPGQSLFLRVGCAL